MLLSDPRDCMRCNTSELTLQIKKKFVAHGLLLRDSLHSFCCLRALCRGAVQPCYVAILHRLPQWIVWCERGPLVLCLNAG